MEPTDEHLTLAVEYARHEIVVMRVAGDLNSGRVDRLARLLATCVSPVPGGVHRSHLVVDLGDVRSFGVVGLEVLRQTELACTRSSMSLHVTGVAARIEALPPDVGAMLADFSCFPTLEDALDALTASAGPEVSAGPITPVDRVIDARRHGRQRRRAHLLDGAG